MDATSNSGRAGPDCANVAEQTIAAAIDQTKRDHSHLYDIAPKRSMNQRAHPAASTREDRAADIIGRPPRPGKLPRPRILGAAPAAGGDAGHDGRIPHGIGLERRGVVGRNAGGATPPLAAA